MAKNTHVVRDVVVALSIALTGCTDRPLQDDAAENDVHVATQALTAAVTVRLPPQVTLAGTVVSGETGVSLGVRTNVGGPAVSAAGKVHAGVSSITGSIVAARDVNLGNTARVDGPVRAGGALVRGRDVVITGPVTAGQPIGPPTIHSWTVNTPAGNMGAISVAQDQIRDLAPGSYGDLTLKPRSKIVLHSGVYSFAKVTVEPNAELLIDNAAGVVQVYATGQVSFKGCVHPARFGVPQFLLGALGSYDVAIHSAFVGVVVAPAATIRLKVRQARGPPGRVPR